MSVAVLGLGRRIGSVHQNVTGEQKYQHHDEADEAGDIGNILRAEQGRLEGYDEGNKPAEVSYDQFRVHDWGESGCKVMITGFSASIRLRMACYLRSAIGT